MFRLPDLPYSYDALEVAIDAKTMEIHHTKHHQAYIDKLNAALEKYPDLQEKSVIELISNLEAVPEDIRTAVRNHGGGHANHSFFWTILSPTPQAEPSGKLAEDMIAKFGSVEEFKKQFEATATAHFGSGWCWLAWGADEGLHVHALPNQDSPIMHQHKPILGVDVWEHAYYLKYQNKRPEYLSTIWQVIDWKAVSDYYEQAVE